jgi:hypothetical protein
LFDLLHDKDKKSFKSKSPEDKQKHMIYKTQKVIKAFRSKPLTEEEKVKASKILDSMEDLF